MYETETKPEHFQVMLSGLVLGAYKRKTKKAST